MCVGGGVQLDTIGMMWSAGWELEGENRLKGRRKGRLEGKVVMMELMSRVEGGICEVKQNEEGGGGE